MVVDSRDAIGYVCYVYFVFHSQFVVDIERTAEIDLIGLVRDEEAMHAERLKLWDEFNKCWQSLLGRQMELTFAWQTSGSRPHSPQSLLDMDIMETMGNRITLLCDGIEKYGLVDYQMGVEEEVIIDRRLFIVNNGNTLCIWLTVAN